MPQQAKTPLVVIPTYNEAGNLRALVAAVYAALPEASILIVDDASPDGTGRLADDLAARYPALAVLHRPGKQGLATAYVAGFRYALEREVDCVVAMDADFSHDPRYLPLLLATTGAADLVIGSRYVRGGRTPGWCASRRLISGFGNLFARTALRLPVHDCTAGFRCYRRCVLEALDLEAIRLEGYAFQIATVYQSYRHGFRIQEVPIVFRDRRVGTSKMSAAIVAEALTYVLGQLRVAAQEHGHARRVRRGDGRAATPRGPIGLTDQAGAGKVAFAGRWVLGARASRPSRPLRPGRAGCQPRHGSYLSTNIPASTHVLDGSCPAVNE